MRSAKRSADNDGDSSVVRQRTANDPDGSDPDPNVGANAAIKVDGRDAEALSRRIVELEAQVASIPACQEYARQMEAERDLLKGKLSSEAHAAEEQL